MFFAVKIGHFLVNAFLPCVSSTQALELKLKNKDKQSLVGLPSHLHLHEKNKTFDMA